MARKRLAASSAPARRNKRCRRDEQPEPVEEQTVLKNSAPDEDIFIGDPVPDAEARGRWPRRYEGGEEGKDNYICKIVEMFEDLDGMRYFTAQWFYRAKDTVIKSLDKFIESKRVFLSEVKDDNLIDCLVRKLNIVCFPPNENIKSTERIPLECDFYCDMMYHVPYSTFISFPHAEAVRELDSILSSESSTAEIKEHVYENTLLDLYSGCGAMSTGLCLGAVNYGVKLVTKWAVDFNREACDSLRLNHPETQVRNEAAQDFLCLLKEWEHLCVSCSLITSNSAPHPCLNICNEEEEEEEETSDTDNEVYEVEQVLEVCFGDPKKTGKSGLHFKIRWKGYGEADDTWEPIEGLSGCEQKMKEFIENGFKANILPLPGSVDVVCGGPPCQGISGFNRFRNSENPLEDPKNKQLEVFMDIVNFLRPRFVLMENVVDIVKFSNGFLGRCAISQLVGMSYQARLGMMVAGSYGLPQFRMRVFLWGALPAEKLPQYPLPTHDVVVRGFVPIEFESNNVAYDEGHGHRLKKKLLLGDAISDLPHVYETSMPHVKNNESRDEMEYDEQPKNGFQKYIRLGRDGNLGHVLYDHCPLQLNEDDYTRGANYRNLKGVIVRGNKAELDPTIERVYLPSGKPLVPNYALSFTGGTSTEPFGRVWWDETVPTVVTRAQPHNRAILHPEQDRVLTVRENARLQGFPDYYKLSGSITERYKQVGNAVAVPVARALGYSLAMAIKGESEDKNPVFCLPEGFAEVSVPVGQ
ncbi:hypothetical protein DM860_001841 [Cuscuta australis]|uniref:DNA (cytosine-5-)-methyltransferase n=1 Tax=Cuscuta australis TaxID=267555 RepID=A0A328EDR6_9ASTE|nr:hypothetical protein DM860_001841 [Cuscuta australis]